jgi:hypothetical protein
VILGFASLIIYSRFYLGVHAINQLLYGSTLGVTTYVFIFHVLEMDKYDYREFFSTFNTMFNNIIYWSFYISFVIITILLYNLNNVDETYRNYVTSKCPTIKHYRLLQHDALSDSLLIFALIGSHLGFTILQILLKNYYPEEDKLQCLYEFANTDLKKTLLRSVYLALVAIPSLIPLAAISDNADFTTICVFKIAIPYFSTVAIVNSVGLFYALKLNITNNKILDKNAIDSSENKEVKEKENTELKEIKENI